MYVCTHVCPYEGMSVGWIDCLTGNMIIHEKMYVRMSKMKVSSLSSSQSHRRTEGGGGGTVLRPPLLEHFVKDFAKRDDYISQYSPPPPPFELLCTPMLGVLVC